MLAVTLMLLSMAPSLAFAEKDDDAAPLGMGLGMHDAVPVKAGVAAQARAGMQEGDKDRVQDRDRDHEDQDVNWTPILDRVQERARDRLESLDQDQLRKTVNLSEDQLEKLAKLDRSRMKEYASMGAEKLAQRLDKVVIKQVRKEEAFRKRAVAHEHVLAAQQRFEQAQSNYSRAKEVFEQRQQAWQRAVQAGNESAAIDHAKAYLGAAADMVIDSLEKVRARVEANDDLSDDEASQALADIDERIAAMRQAKDALEQAQTKAEVKAAGEDILGEWQRTRYRLELRAEQVVNAQVGDILSRSEALEQHLDRVLSQMEADNVSVDDLESRLDTFSTLIASAREKLENSSELFKEAKDGGDRSLLDESKALARSAHDDLKEAHVVLMGIVREVNAAGYDVEDDDEYVQVVEEDDGGPGDEGASVNETVEVNVSVENDTLNVTGDEDLDLNLTDDNNQTGGNATSQE